MDSLRKKIINNHTAQLQGQLQEQEMKNGKKQFIKKLSFVFLALFLLFGLFIFSRAQNFFSVINNTDKSKAAILFPMAEDIELFKDKNRTNILLLGIRGEDDMEHGGLLADTIMVASIDDKTKKAALISVPRDTYLQIPGTQRKEKINASYLIGEEKLPNGGGLELTKRSVEYVTGLYIDHVVSVDFKAFKEVIDELGGVDIYLEKEFSENRQWGVNFYVAPGEQHLNGDVALYYVRSRYSTNDFDRARRQQQVLVAMKNQATEIGFLANPFKINAILEILENRIKTDITIFDIVKFSKSVQQIDDKNIKHKVFSTEDGTLTHTTINGAYVLLPKDGSFNKIREISKNILNN